MRNFIIMRSAMRLKAFSGLQVSLPKRSFTKIMTEKHLKRGASVQLLHPGGLPNLTNEDLVFAESFSTFSVRNAKKLDNIQETLDATGGATTNNAILDSVLETVKNILDLKIRATSTLTLERLVKKFTEDFENLSPEDKAKLFIHLATVHFINEDNLRAKAKDVSECHDKEILLRSESQLRQILDPDYNWLFSKIAQVSGHGVKFLCDFRADMLSVLHQKNLTNTERSAVRTMSGHLKDLLSHWFSAGLLELEQITWQSSCLMLQKISDYEAVHPIKNWTDLKSRVGPYRRCFVFTHRSMPGEPIVVLHVALTTEIVATIRSVVKHHRKVKRTNTVEIEDLHPLSEWEHIKGSAGTEDPALCTTSIFYSITSTQTGLQGIELGNSLIKQAVKKLKEEFPSMNQFSTLSPIPGFRTWLLQTLHMSRKGEIPELIFEDEKTRISKAFYGPSDDFYESLSTAIQSNQWAQNDKLRIELEGVLMRLCARYLFVEKRRNFALDPVANFHLRNGATMWRLNWWADLSPRGLTNSCGIMVNYRYYLDKLESNSTTYQEEKIIHASEQVRQLASRSALLLVNVKKDSKL